MDILEAIQTRRSSGFVTQAPVAEELVETLLQAAAWAPTHRRTEPWRFHVFSGDGRQHLAKAIADGTEASMGEKVYRAPVVIAAVAAIGEGQAAKPVPAWEEEAATAAALQNMALAAHGLGLAGIWRTGKFTELESVKALLKAGEKDRIMGFFYLGHPDVTKLTPLRPTPNWRAKTVFYKSVN